MCFTSLFLIYTRTEWQIPNAVACNGASDQLGLRQHKKVSLYFAFLHIPNSFHTPFSDSSIGLFYTQYKFPIAELQL